MTDRDFNQKLDELDRLLNDPTVQLEPARVWSLLAEVSPHTPVGWAGPHGHRVAG